MKKLFFYAAAAVGMLSACSSNDDFTAPNGENEGREAIKIGVSSIAAQVGTRGTGTVGGVYDGETEVTPNKWAGQKINVYMFEKGTLDLAIGNRTELYNNAEMTTPVGEVTGEADLAGKDFKYYPPVGAFDFWGYRLDGANGTEVPAADATENPTNMNVDFTIDGTQDVMRAKAEYTVPESGYPGTVTEADIYSAKAARQGIQPELVFSHLLTRFTFQIKGGNESSCPKAAETEGEEPDATTAVTIKSVELTSRTNGNLIVAHTGDAPEAGYITWKEDETTSAAEGTEPTDGVATADGKFLPYLMLKQRATKEIYDPDNEGEKITVDDENADLVAMTDQIPNVWKDDKCEAKTIGEALLVSPELDEYTVRVVVEQKVLKHAIAEGAEATDDDYETKSNTIELPIRPADVVKGDVTGIEKFLAGTSYNVIITVYGFERIVINTTLTPWQEGGDIEIGQD